LVLLDVKFEGTTILCNISNRLRVYKEWHSWSFEYSVKEPKILVHLLLGVLRDIAIFLAWDKPFFLMIFVVLSLMKTEAWICFLLVFVFHLFLCALSWSTGFLPELSSRRKWTPRSEISEAADRACWSVMFEACWEHGCVVMRWLILCLK